MLGSPYSKPVSMAANHTHPPGAGQAGLAPGSPGPARSPGSPGPPKFPGSPGLRGPFGQRTPVKGGGGSGLLISKLLCGCKDVFFYLRDSGLS